MEQYYLENLPMGNIDSVLLLLSLGWRKEDEPNHFINFNRGHFGVVESIDWYGVAPFSPMVFLHPIVTTSYSVTPICSRMVWPVLRFYVNCCHYYGQFKRSSELFIEPYESRKVKVKDAVFIAIVSRWSIIFSFEAAALLLPELPVGWHPFRSFPYSSGREQCDFPPPVRVIAAGSCCCHTK